jgi:glycosyltransferase involved in cell wall biosynthesis
MSNRRLLFVTYVFPPLRVIGCVRTWNIAKYLTRAGWTVTVLTVDPSLWRDIEHPDEVETSLNEDGIHRLSTDHEWRWLARNVVKGSDDALSWLLGGIGRRVATFVGIDGSMGWVRPAERSCSNLVPGDVDIILASGPPFSTFSLAQRLAQRLRCPYVLDYRDLWSHDLRAPVPTAAKREASVIAGSAAVTTVSPSWALVMDRQFGVGAKIHIVSNGYDPNHLETVRAHVFGHFAIVYAGTLWPPKRTISPVMSALRRLKDVAHGSASWMFHYYGPHGSYVREEAGRFGVTDKVLLHGIAQRTTALEAVKGAGVSIVITSVESHATLVDNGMVTGKIFEAIGLGTPVLVIGPDGSDANVVVETTGLGRRFAASDVEGIASFLRELANGVVPEPKDTAAYAWGNLVNTLDGVLREAISA